ncbi:hypothetical protein NE237_010456 [Protea cynaroides]|uniref:Uncharacterized protein n=1 Tax=Protea cynaroides TaxID=273540 RepID=A0A9Q0KZT5_9MAGN|nr:hypothetical protein NE237_010456 [Protea cynaroides]
MPPNESSDVDKSLETEWADAAKDEDLENDDDDIAYEDKEVEGVEEGAKSSSRIITSSQGGTLMVGENGRVEVVFPDVQYVDRALLNADEALQTSAGAFTEVGKCHCGHPTSWAFLAADFFSPLSFVKALIVAFFSFLALKSWERKALTSFGTSIFSLYSESWKCSASTSARRSLTISYCSIVVADYSISANVADFSSSASVADFIILSDVADFNTPTIIVDFSNSIATD